MSESDWGDDEAEEARDKFLTDEKKALQIEEPIDAHGEQAGGTLVSVALGIIKGVYIRLLMGAGGNSIFSKHAARYQ